MKPEQISDNTRRVLKNLLNGLPAYAHCRTRADYGGLHSTLRAMRKHGFLTDGFELTQRGQEIANKLNQQG